MIMCEQEELSPGNEFCLRLLTSRTVEIKACYLSSLVPSYAAHTNLACESCEGPTDSHCSHRECANLPQRRVHLVRGTLSQATLWHKHPEVLGFERTLQCFPMLTQMLTITSPLYIRRNAKGPEDSALCLVFDQVGPTISSPHATIPRVSSSVSSVQ